jgi:hypothetical protein
MAEATLVSQVDGIHGAIGLRLPELVSVWSGTVEARAWRHPQTGEKDWSCAIGLADWLVAGHDFFNLGWSNAQLRGLLYSTIVHEVLHAYSPGRSREAFLAFRALEEGSVEALTRQIRAGVLEGIGVSPSELDFGPSDNINNYEPILRELETMRGAITASETEFTERLFSARMEARPRWLHDQARSGGNQEALDSVDRALERLGYSADDWGSDGSN